MYESFYGLRERPFNLVPDPRFLFLTRQHTEALTHLQYGLTGRPGVTVLIGEAGTGKSTLVRKALGAISRESVPNRIVELSNPTLTRAEFYEYLAHGFGFSPDASASKPKFLFELEEALKTERGVVALVVDEAQSLPDDLLEEIRLLTNLQTPSGRALTMMLVGQPELGARLNESQLRQLKQRVALRCELAPLALHDTLAYIARRVAVAGGAADQLFTRTAAEVVHNRSRGIPRTISVICDNALVNGFAANMKPVSAGLVEEVCRDFQIGDVEPRPATVPVAAPSPVAPAVAAVPAAVEATAAPPPRRRAGIFAEPEAPRPAPQAVVEEAAKETSGADHNEESSMFAGYARKKRFSIF